MTQAELGDHTRAVSIRMGMRSAAWHRLRSPRPRRRKEEQQDLSPTPAHPQRFAAQGVASLALGATLARSAPHSACQSRMKMLPVACQCTVATSATRHVRAIPPGHLEACEPVRGASMEIRSPGDLTVWSAVHRGDSFQEYPTAAVKSPR